MKCSRFQDRCSLGLLRLRSVGTRGKLHPLLGIDVYAVDVKNPVKVGAGRASGGTGVAEDVAALDLRTGDGDKFGHVEIHGLKTLSVVDADGIAEHVELLRERDGASGDGADGFARGSPLVHAAVVLAGRLSIVKASDAERRRHAAGDGRGERILPKTRFRDLFLEGGQQCDFFRS